RKAEMLVEPEARAAAELDGVSIIFAGITFQISGAESIFRSEVTHIALNARLPLDGAIIEQRLGIADVSRAAELGNINGILVVRPIGRAADTVVAAENSDCFDAVADNVPDLVQLGYRGPRKIQSGKGRSQPNEPTWKRVSRR